MVILGFLKNIVVIIIIIIDREILLLLLEDLRVFVKFEIDATIIIRLSVVITNFEQFPIFDFLVVETFHLLVRDERGEFTGCF